MFRFNINKLNYLLFVLFCLPVLLNVIYNKVNPKVKLNFLEKKNVEKMSKAEFEPKMRVENLIKLEDLINVKVFEEKKNEISSNKIKIKKEETSDQNRFLIKPLKNVSKDKFNNLTIRPLKLSNEENNLNLKEKELVLNPIKLSLKKNNKDHLNMKKTSKILNKVNKPYDIKIKKLSNSVIIKTGLNLINKNTKLSFSFKWPNDIRKHDKIFAWMKSCLGVKGVLIDTKNNIYSKESKLNRKTIKTYSKFFRKPTAIYSTKEKNILKTIKNKYSISNYYGYFRLFPLKVDAFIFGHFNKISNQNNEKLKNFSAVYKIEDSGLYLDDLIINNKKIKSKIDLSIFSTGCQK